MTPRIDFVARHRLKLFFLIRFLFVGGVAAATNLVLLFALKEYFHVWYLTASTVAFIVSGIVSFTAQKFITFRDRAIDNVHRQVVLYFAVATLNIFVNAGLMFSFVEWAHIHYLLAQVFSAGIIAVWNLVAYRYIVFKPTPLSEN